MRKILQFLRDWLWSKPTEEDQEPKATEVIQHFVCVKYKDQWINMRKSEIQAWNNMSRKDRRAMALRFKVMEKKGKVKFVRINGQMTCVKNKDYGKSGNKPGESKTGSGK